MTNDEYQARKMLCSAADYLYRNQLGDYSRVQAMDLLLLTTQRNCNRL